MLSTFQKLRFSLVVIQFVSLDGIVAILFKRIFKTKVVFFAIGSDILKLEEHVPFYQTVIKRVLAESDFVFCVNSQIENKLKKMGCSVSKLKVVPSIINFDDFKPYYGEKEYDLTTVGSLDFNKNQMMLLKACKLLPRIKVLIIGDGPLRGVLKSESLKENIDAVFLGNITHEQVFRELQKSLIYVQLSKSEGSPAAILEAMLAGLPVIATGSSYSYDLKNRYGFSIHTFEEGGIVELASVISQILRTYESECNKAALNKQKMLNLLNENSFEIKTTLDRLLCSAI
jgi:glycosyltransferase involved in cell wall biosynthesis